MLIFHILLFLALLAALGVLCWVVINVRLSERKRRLLADAHGTSCDMLDCIGISVLCSGVKDTEQIENLLTPEYARYEVVLALDSRRSVTEFADIVARYRMIRVDYAPTDEFPAVGVRGLYRSRKRCFRRLVLLDRQTDAPGENPRIGSVRAAAVHEYNRIADLDAAAGAATYDFVIPLSGKTFLMPGAIDRLVVELSEYPAGEVALIRSYPGPSVRLLGRDAVIEAGGFGWHPERKVVRRRRKMVWEPLLWSGAPCAAASPEEAQPCSDCRPFWMAMGVLSAGIAFALWGGSVVVCAVLLTLMLVAVVLRYASYLLPAAMRGSCGDPVLWFPVLRK